MPHVEIEHFHLPLCRLHESEQRFDHRALAGAVRAEQADGAGRELGRDVAERPLPAIADTNAVKGHNGRHWANYTFESFESFESFDGPSPRASARVRRNVITLRTCSSNGSSSSTAPC